MRVGASVCLPMSSENGVIISNSFISSGKKTSRKDSRRPSCRFLSYVSASPAVNAQKSPEELVLKAEPGLANLGEGGPRLCIFGKLPGDAQAAHPRTKFRGATTCTMYPPNVVVRFR